MNADDGKIFLISDAQLQRNRTEFRKTWNLNKSIEASNTTQFRVCTSELTGKRSETKVCHVLYYRDIHVNNN